MKIENVKIKNFKSLRNIDISLGNITLLSGVNSCGKSSFIQTLLLLKQNEDRIHMTRNPILNIKGNYLDLGNKRDILYQEAFDENISIEISSNTINSCINFNNKDLKIVSENFPLLGTEKSFNLFNEDFQYISTDRVTPSITYGLSDENIKKNLIGIKGEYTAHYLAVNSRKKLQIEALKHPNSKTEQLLENVSLWLGDISNGIEVKAKVYEELQSVNLTYNYSYGDTTTNDFTPLNIGFGITYSLPIIVAILKSKPNDLLIIENPESHLHPSGQSKIAEICAIAAENGVQIIIETHSDHFLNGLRVATKKKIIKPENSQIYYFRKEENSLESITDNLQIDEEGRINQEWPKGFFDEWDNNLDELLW
jgi:predicted ATPase